MNDFRKYATKHIGIDGMVLDDVIKYQNQYLNPYILEERKLIVTQMDVFSRLMMDRIIFLGTQIDDYTANTLQAQLLYLDSVEPDKDISIYINSPLGGVQGQASDIEIEAKEIIKFKKELYTIISNHSHQPYDKVWNDSDRNYWMTSEEAKDYGMIDQVLERKKGDISDERK